MAKYKFISDEQDYKHLTDKERYKNLYEEVGTVEANKSIKWRIEWMKYFSPKPNSTILELGSHNGPNLLKYSREGFQIDGVELSQTLINTFKKNCLKESDAIQNRINLYHSWIEDFKIDKRYDYVLVTEVLEHVIDPIKILKVAQMHLKKNGIIYISSPTKHWGNNTHVRGVPKEDLMNWLVKSNLSPIEIWEEDGRTFCYARQKNKTKIIGLLRVRNEEQIILDTLKHMERFCNGGIFVYDDCSEDNTAEICENFQAVKKVIRGTVWDKNRAKAEFENRDAVLQDAKKISSEDDWFVYLDADERIDYDWSKLYEYSKDVIAIRMKLFDFYITPEDVNKLYTERKKLGPEYRKIIMAFRNLPTLEYKYLDQREVTLGVEGKIIDEGYVKHYGKAISIEEWEKTCDYYSKHFPMYSEKWEKRKGKAIHSKYSDFGNELISWEEREEKGINLYEFENKLKNVGNEHIFKILITNHHLSGYTGSEIFTLTLAKNLKKHGYLITVYSKYIGEIGKEFQNFGIRIIDNLNEIENEQFDLAHVHHNVSLIELRHVFPKLPVVFLSQGILPFLEQPPIFDLGISKYLAISSEIKESLINSGILKNKIEIIGNIIDIEEFKVDREINNSPEKALVISGRIDKEKEMIIRKACKELKINIEFIGGRFGEVNQQILIKKIEESDIIFSLGRGAIEGMITGRCVIIYDYLGADGIITTYSYHEIKKNNFSGRRFGKKYNVFDLKNEIKKYNVDEIKKVQALAIKNYSASNVVLRLEKIYQKVVQDKNVLYPDKNLELATFINNIVHETFVYSFTKGVRQADFAKEETTSELILFAEKLIQEGKNEAAEIILEEIIHKYPEGLDALNDLAVVSILKNDKEKALNLLDKVLTIEPTNEIAIENFNYLSEYLEKDNSDHHNSSNKKNLDSDEFKISHAEELIQNNQLVEAAKILEELIEFDSQNVAALIDLSVIATLEMNFQKAKKLLTKALEINPDNETALENMIYIDQQINFNANKNKVAAHFETITCPFCNSEKSEQYRSSADIVKCMECDTIYLRTRFNKERMYELYQSYANDDSHMALPSSVTEIKSSGLRRDYFMNEILEFVKPKGYFLDIGCGWGAFLDNARDRGFTPRGIEMTKRCVAFANNELNIKVTNEQFEDTDFKEGSFSVVTLNHVLEHLPFPKKAIEKINKVLIPGGMFCGIVPNINSFVSKLLTEDWYWLDPNYHYVHYTPETLTKHLKNAGFIVERLYTTSGDYGINNVKKELKKIFNQTDAEIENKLQDIEKNGEGEEIRFFARKPK